MLFSARSRGSRNYLGMFLYAKIVLSGIELIDDVAEICEDLSILPEDLDDA
jgi:hypothetical protein